MNEKGCDPHSQGITHKQERRNIIDNQCAILLGDRNCQITQIGLKRKDTPHGVVHDPSIMIFALDAH